MPANPLPVRTVSWGSPPAVAADEVRVWALQLDEPPVEAAELFACLTDDERARAERYKVEKARRHFVVGRGLLRTLLGQFLGQPAREVPIAYTGAGKPILGTGDVHFNVTHTDTLALIALAARPVGVDVERVRAVANPAGLVGRFFSAAERAAYESLPDEQRLTGFFRGWVCKEAVIKAAGLSVLCLDEFDVELHPDRPPAVLAARNAALVGAHWGLTAWEPAAGFAAAVAVEVEGTNEKRPG